MNEFGTSVLHLEKEAELARLMEAERKRQEELQKQQEELRRQTEALQREREQMERVKEELERQRQLEMQVCSVYCLHVALRCVLCIPAEIRHGVVLV